MPKIKINSVDFRSFTDAAEAARTTVDEWLAEAGRAQAFKEAHGMSRVVVPGRSPLSQAWEETLRDLTGEISTSDLTYLMLTRLHAVLDDTALITVSDAFTRDVIESRLRAPVAEALSRRLGRPVHVAITLNRPPEAPQPAPADRLDVEDRMARLDQAVQAAEKRRRKTADRPV